jgi:hypothetical protein
VKWVKILIEMCENGWEFGCENGVDLGEMGEIVGNVGEMMVKWW